MTRSIAAVLSISMLISLLSGCSMSKPTPPKRCVDANAMILTPGGEVPASRLEPGDLVTSVMPDGLLGIGQVTAKHTFGVDQILMLTLENGVRLGVTDTHPIAIETGVYRHAGELSVGDRIALATGQSVISAIETRTGPQEVVDLTVIPHQNFIANRVVTHNKVTITLPTNESALGQYFSPRARIALEITEGGGRVGMASPGNTLGSTSDSDSIWQITSWTLEGYTLTAELSRAHAEDWLSRAMPEADATLTIGMFGPSTIYSFRIRTPTHNYGVPGYWITEEQMDAARSLLESP